MCVCMCIYVCVCMYIYIYGIDILDATWAKTPAASVSRCGPDAVVGRGCQVFRNSASQACIASRRRWLLPFEVALGSASPCPCVAKGVRTVN